MSVEGTSQRSAQAPVLELALPAEPESISIVRQALAGLSEALELPGEMASDLTTVVVEACNNVVVHAYPGDETGPLHVAVGHRNETVHASVRDRGEGFRPRPTDPSEPSLRLGLPMIAAISDTFEIRGGSGAGTEVMMTLREDGAGAGPAPAREVETQRAEVEVQPSPIARPVLARIVGALGARADLPLDRLADSVMLSDAISAHSSSDFPSGRLTISLDGSRGWIELRVGPLREGGGERLLEAMRLPGTEDASLGKLASSIAVSATDRGEFLLLKIER